MEYYDGDMFRMDACRFCRCQGGVSICFSAQCGELHCDRYYVPEGECCPVCEGTLSFQYFLFINSVAFFLFCPFKENKPASASCCCKVCQLFLNSIYFLLFLIVVSEYNILYFCGVSLMLTLCHFPIEMLRFPFPSGLEHS